MRNTFVPFLILSGLGKQKEIIDEDITYKDVENKMRTPKTEECVGYVLLKKGLSFVQW
jgi:hypothetical protein